MTNEVARKHLLIVDDEPVILQILKAVFDDEPVRVTRRFRKGRPKGS